MGKKLSRSRTDRMVWGVCGGLARYFDIDPAIVRVVFVLLLFANGMGILLYIVLAIVIPLEGTTTTDSRETMKENIAEMKQTAGELGRELSSSIKGESGEEPSAKVSRSRSLVGIVLIIIGVLFLLGSLNLFRWFAWAYVWPLLVILVGLILIVSGTKRK